MLGNVGQGLALNCLTVNNLLFSFAAKVRNQWCVCMCVGGVLCEFMCGYIDVCVCVCACLR